ncbi:unnamed protein product [Calypogeia fissa]
MAYTQKSFLGSTLLISYFVLLCTEFKPVVPQTPSASPRPSAGGVAPVPGEAPAPAGPLQPEPQVTNMIEALRDAGRFGAIAGLLDGLQMKSVTPMTTWFLPNDQAFSDINYPKNVTTFLDYHVVRELLPFSRLLTLSIGTRIPTFLDKEVIVVTNNSQFNFSIDNAMMVVPDLYSDSTVAVHGINAVLDDASFNGIARPPAAPIVSPVAAPPLWLPMPAGEVPFNVTIPNVAHHLHAFSGLYLAFASASILLAAVLS